MAASTGLSVGRYALPVGGVVIPSGDYSDAAANPAAVEIPTLGATAIVFSLNVSVISGAGATVTLNLERFDAASQTWVALGTAIAVATVSFNAVRVDPRIPAGANSYQVPVPGRVRVRPIKSGTATTLTYSVGADLCL